MFFTDWEEKSKGLKVKATLLWEYDLTDFPWYDMRTQVMQRIIERGWMEDFYAAIKLYGGLDNIKEIIKEIPELTDKEVAFVCAVFDLKKEDLKCHTWRQSREKLLSS